MKEDVLWALLHRTWESFSKWKDYLNYLIYVNNSDLLLKGNLVELQNEYPEIPEEMFEKWIIQRNKTDLGKWESYLVNHQIKMHYYAKSDYPNCLRHISNPPAIIYVKGSIPNKRLSIGMVGSRKADSYGMTVAESIAYELSNEEVCIVSGLAKGIDAASHKGALKGSGGTIAVLGCGVDKIYPAENKNLAESILAHPNGCIVSEFALGGIYAPWHFPLRNRIISGFSNGIIVIQAQEKSGVYSTVESALSQGKDIFAVPGAINSSLSYAPNRFIQEGAMLVVNGNDVLNWYQMDSIIREKKPDNKSLNKLVEKKSYTLPQDIILTDDEKRVLLLFREGSFHIEEIAVKIGKPINQISSLLSMLEIYGLVKQQPGRIYSRT